MTRIKTLVAGHIQFLLYEVITRKQHCPLIISLAILSGLSSYLSQRFVGRQMPHIFLTFRYKHIARRLASNINLYMACYKMPRFLFQRTLFLFHIHFSCYIFFPPFLEEKEITSMESGPPFSLISPYSVL
jgi:hypothetical protein